MNIDGVVLFHRSKNFTSDIFHVLEIFPYSVSLIPLNGFLNINLYKFYSVAFNFAMNLNCIVVLLVNLKS